MLGLPSYVLSKVVIKKNLTGARASAGAASLGMDLGLGLSLSLSFSHTLSLLGWDYDYVSAFFCLLGSCALYKWC
jgi:hypothetical protein